MAKASALDASRMNLAPIALDTLWFAVKIEQPPLLNSVQPSLLSYASVLLAAFKEVVNLLLQLNKAVDRKPDKALVYSNRRKVSSKLSVNETAIYTSEEIHRLSNP
jgi:hypothetical protein